jgi:hypothetical protein
MPIFFGGILERGPFQGRVAMGDDYQILTILGRHGVPVVIVGAHAVNFHGYGRAGENIDVVWLRTPEAEQSLLQALIEVDARYIGDETDPATGLERMHPVTLPYIQAQRLMMLCTRHGFLDLFDYVPGIPQQDVADLFASSVESNGLRYVSLQWLRKMKEASGRGKDLLDLENLPP